MRVGVAQRAQRAGAMSGRFEHAGDQVRGGGLAVGARDADHAQLSAGIAGQGLADAAQRVARIGDDANRHADRQRALGDHRRGAAGHGFGDKIMAVAARAGDRHENVARRGKPPRRTSSFERRMSSAP